MTQDKPSGTANLAVDIPIACRLTTPELARRKEELRATLFAEVEETRPLADGHAFRFSGAGDGGDIVGRLAAFVAAERVCCPFLAFEIVCGPGEGPVWLHLRGGEGVKAFIAQTFLPDQA